MCEHFFVVEQVAAVAFWLFRYSTQWGILHCKSYRFPGHCWQGSARGLVYLNMDECSTKCQWISASNRRKANPIDCSIDSNYHYLIPVVARWTSRIFFSLDYRQNRAAVVSMIVFGVWDDSYEWKPGFECKTTNPTGTTHLLRALSSQSLEVK